MEKELNTTEKPIFWIGLDVAKDSFTAAAKCLWEKNILRPEKSVFTRDRSGARALYKWYNMLKEKYACSYIVPL